MQKCDVKTMIYENFVEQECKFPKYIALFFRFVSKESIGSEIYIERAIVSVVTNM